MWTVQDAKNKFSAVVEAALAGTPQAVTRRGKPAVVVLSAEEYHCVLTPKPAEYRDKLVLPGYSRLWAANQGLAGKVLIGWR